MKFTDLEIIEPILRALEDEGYESPTPIQEQTIPVTLEGRDVLGLAQTGTGKTAAFAVPTLQTLAKNIQNGRNRKIRALVLTPTRELGTQVYESFENYGHYLPLQSTVIFGGTSQGKQVNALRSGIDVLVATPGRLIDLMNQGHVKLSDVEIFILDEADRMLDMGFIHDIKRIVKYLPKKKQTLLFSATMPKEIEEIVDELLVNPVQVSVDPVSSTVDTVEQFVQYVDQVNKVNLFADFIEMTNGEPVLVFTRTKRGADRVVRELKKRKIDAVAIHGDKSQMARQKALENFKEYRTQILVATDIASRGIDISELPYVINFDMPEVPETYVHRIGRTGRAGNTGRAISYVNYQEIHLLKDIEKLIKMKLTVVENERYPLEDKTEKKKKQARKRNDSRPSKSQEVSKAKGSRPNKAKRSSDKRSRAGKEESSKRGERTFSKTQRNTNGRNRKRHGSKTKK